MCYFFVLNIVNRDGQDFRFESTKKPTQQGEIEDLAT